MCGATSANPQPSAIETQKLISLGKMTQEVVHDLNNLFSIALGHADLALADAAKNGGARRRIRGIRESIAQAAALCREMQLYAGRAEPEPERVDVAALLAQMQPLFRGMVPRAARFECRLAPSLPDVEGHGRLLRHVLVTLVQSAVDAATDPSALQVGIEVDAAPAANAAAGAHVRICVKDNAGASVSTQPETPEASAPDAREFHLAVIRSLLDQMGGGIRMEEERGQEISVALWIPALPDLEEGGETVSLDENGDFDWIGSGTVLFADDEPELRSIASTVLQHAGLCVLTATDGQDAVELFEQHADDIDLVFLDVMMPRLDGCQALRRIRDIRANSRIVIISGYSEMDLVDRWIDAKPDDILLKPIAASALRRMAARHLASLSHDSPTTPGDTL